MPHRRPGRSALFLSAVPAAALQLSLLQEPPLSQVRQRTGHHLVASATEFTAATHHFLVTFTLPAPLRSLARSNQKTIYNLLFRTASQALLQLAQDPRFCGGLIGMVGVLHTWTRALLYHPHVHFIVTGGGWSQDHRWLAARKDFLVPVKALSPIFQAKFREQLSHTDLFQQVPARVWQQ